MANGWAEKVSLREIVYWTIVTAILLWTAFMLVDTLIAAHHLTIPDYAQIPVADRAAVVSAELLSLWEAHVGEWAVVTVGVGMIALLLKP